MVIPVVNYFVLDIDKMCVLLFKRTDNDKVWCIDSNHVISDRRSMMEFLETPFLSSDSEYAISYDDRSVKVESWKDLVDYAF